jgi:hypothetical protein
VITNAGKEECCLDVVNEEAVQSSAVVGRIGAIANSRAAAPVSDS